eukprot:scaffold18482_cov124-Isochrysis_galbana.AAC.2
MGRPGPRKAAGAQVQPRVPNHPQAPRTCLPCGPATGFQAAVDWPAELEAGALALGRQPEQLGRFRHAPIGLIRHLRPK